MDLFNTAQDQIEMNQNYEYFLKCVAKRDADGMKYCLRKIPLFESHQNVLESRFDDLYFPFINYTKFKQHDTVIKETILQVDVDRSVNNEEFTKNSEKHSQTDTKILETNKKVDENKKEIKVLNEEVHRAHFLLELLTFIGLVTYLYLSITSIAEHP